MRVYGKELSYVFCSLAFIYKCDAVVKIVPNFLLLIINRRKQFNLSDLKRGKGIAARCYMMSGNVGRLTRKLGVREKYRMIFIVLPEPV